MIIGVDYQSVRGRRTGIGTAAFYLVEAMRRLKPSWGWKLYDTGSDEDLRTPQRMIWESLSVPRRAASDRADVVYSPGFAPAPWGPAPRVVTVHDLMGLVDSAHLPPGARFYWSQWLPFCVRRAQVLVASSESTRRDVARLLGRDPATIRVIPLGAGELFVRPASDDSVRSARLRYALTQRPYILAVSTLEPRKNAHGLLRAYRLFLDKHPDAPQLCFAGKPGGHEGRIRALIEELGLGRDVRLLGYVPDGDLRALYHDAFAYAFVSFYEGFGLPVLEAMACGRAGVVSSAASIPEVAGDAALYADPADCAGMADQLGRLWKEPHLRGDLEARAVRRSALFSWEKAAIQMIEVFEQTAKIAR